jgi:hypothetical protein
MSEKPTLSLNVNLSPEIQNKLQKLAVAACFRNESGSLSSVRMGSN